MTTKTTTPADLDITATTAAGNTYQVAVYVDPFPGRKGDEVLKETCGKCGGNKVIGYGNVTLQVGKVSGRVCFQCMGKGYTTRLVSSARSTARRQVQAENERRATAVDFAADYDNQVARDLEDAHTEALAEEARRNALVQGFVGQVGERLRNLKATVQVNAKIEVSDFYTGRPFYKNLLILEVEDGRVLKAVVSFSGAERGQEVTVSGTVKAHTNYKGQDQTVLSRVTIK